MKNKQINYKGQVVGYIDNIIFDDNNEIISSEIYLFDTILKDEIVKNITRSTVMTFNNNPDIKNINNNILYQNDLIYNKLILKRI